MYGPYLLSPLLLLSAEPLPPAPCQDGCKAHSAQMTMDGAHVLLPDIGADKIWSFDMAAGEITPSPTPFFQAPGGSVRPAMPCCQAAAWRRLVGSIRSSSWESAGASNQSER